MKVLVTGAKGFIGQNLIKNLSRNKEIEILKFGREDTIEELRKLIEEADFIYHLAAVNRPENEEEFKIVNVGLTKTIDVADKKSEVADIPSVFTHPIENIGEDDMIVLFWANEIFDPDNPDIYYEKG